MIGITKGDLKNSLWNTAVCSFPFFAGLGTAWALHKLGCRVFKTREKSSFHALRVKLFACVVGTVFSFPVATLMPDLVPFSGKKILQFFWLTLLDVGGVIPGFYGQRSLYVIGFTGAVIGAFHQNLFSDSQKKPKEIRKLR